MPKKVGVVLSGCGFQDGAEIHESVFTLYFLDKAGAQAVCMAPDRKQARVVNHASGKPVPGARNVLIESGRIARGDIRDLRSVNPKDLDALILPGGYGAALNLCTFGADGAECSVDPGVDHILREMYLQGKPIGAICIAPAVLARVFGGDLRPELTIGTDEETAKALEKMGAQHVSARVNAIVIDRKNKIVTTPAYMLAKRIGEVAEGVEKLVTAVLEMA